jgi:tetratricopeptide (TPR) repeat protein
MAFGALGLTAPHVRADGQDSASDADTAARTAFEAGRHAYDRGRFDEALALYEHSYALTHRPKMLFNIGRAAEADDQVPRAIEAYEAYLATDQGAENREFVLGRLRVLRGRMTPPGAASASPAVAPQALSDSSFAVFLPYEESRA